MNTAPLSGFRYRSDAERARQALLAAGISSTIREPDEAPSGWRMTPGELKFTIWVAQAQHREASRIIRESMGQADRLTCSRCGAVGATVHITDYQGGEQVTMHLCEACHSQMR